MFARQEDGIKISAQITLERCAEELCLYEQLGIRHCYIWLTPEQATKETLRRLKTHCHHHGIELYHVGVAAYGKSPDIQLGRKECAKYTQRFCDLLTLLGELEISMTTITWEPNGALCTLPDGRCGRQLYQPAARGGAMTRVCDWETLQKMPYSHGRFYSYDEIWENFEKFITRVVPYAERAGVRIALHPNDPPIPCVAGISSLIRSPDDFQRAFDFANSDFLGMELCLGCWLEGPRDVFGSVESAIRRFTEQKKVFVVHFRNVSGAMPYFIETFIDDGYGAMNSYMKELVNNGFNGYLTLDHAPLLTGVGENAQFISNAFALGYIKGLWHDSMQKVQDESRVGR